MGETLEFIDSHNIKHRVLARDLHLRLSDIGIIVDIDGTQGSFQIPKGEYTKLFLEEVQAKYVNGFTHQTFEATSKIVREAMPAHVKPIPTASTEEPDKTLPFMDRGTNRRPRKRVDKQIRNDIERKNQSASIARKHDKRSVLIDKLTANGYVILRKDTHDLVVRKHGSRSDPVMINCHITSNVTYPELKYMSNSAEEGEEIRVVFVKGVPYPLCLDRTARALYQEVPPVRFKKDSGKYGYEHRVPLGEIAEKDLPALHPNEVFGLDKETGYSEIEGEN